MASKHLRRLALVAGLGCAALAVLTPGTAKAANLGGDDGSCQTAANLGSKVWSETPGFVKEAVSSSGPFGATAISAIRMIDKGVQIWNKLANDKSWAKIGPRRMDFNEWNQGHLIGFTERMFLSGIPAPNPVKFDFHKTGHDGEVKVVVCRIPKKGPPIVVKSFTVPANAPEGKIKSFTINKAKGHVISVVLHGKSLSRSLNYKLRAKLVYEDDPPEHEVSGSRGDGTTVSAPRTSGTVSAPR